LQNNIIINKVIVFCDKTTKNNQKFKNLSGRKTKIMTMTYNQVLFLGIVELLTFFIIICLIIRANVFVNALQKEINDLYLYLPEIIREIRYDLKELNAELSSHFSEEGVSPQTLGVIVGKICKEIIIYRLNSLQISRKFVIIKMLLKTLNIKKFLKPLFFVKTVR